MMAATVEMPIVVKVDEVYQGLTTGLASKTRSVPAAPLTSPGRKHPVLSWIQQLLALPKQRRWAGQKPNLLSLSPGSATTTPHLVVRTVLQAHLHQRGPLPKPGFPLPLTFTKSLILKTSLH